MHADIGRNLDRVLLCKNKYAVYALDINNCTGRLHKAGAKTDTTLQGNADIPLNISSLHSAMKY